MMHGSFENTTYKDIITLLGKFYLKMSIFCNIQDYLVYKINN